PPTPRPPCARGAGGRTRPAGANEGGGGGRHTPVASAPVKTVVSIRALRMGTSRDGVRAERSVARSLCRGVAACQACRVGATAALAAPTVVVIADDGLTAATHSHPAESGVGSPRSGSGGW